MILSKNPVGRVLLASFFLVSASQAAPPGNGWTKAWGDEFDGTTLNTSNWTIGTGARWDATNTASAVSVGNGNLRIKTYTENGNHYTGWIASNGKFEECFGYWEARIKFNSSQGMWSAFWLQPYGINNVGDPAGNGTEIDIVEHRSQDNGAADLRNKSAINIHWDGYVSGTTQSVGTVVNNPGVDSSLLQGNYHTYGLLWEGGRYTMYIDGAQVWTTTAAISNVRQWIYLTSEVRSGSWSGSIPSGGYGTAANTSTYFDVDYVRFYQRSEQTVNGNFNYRMGPWRQSGQTSWNSTGGVGGGPGVYLNPTTTSGSKASMPVYGLLPNTPYVVRGMGNVGSRAWPDIRIGAESYGGSQVYGAVWSNGFTQAEAAFTTGSSNTTANIFASVPTQWGTCYADDIYIRRAGRFTNGGFELGDDSAWSLSGDSLVQNWGGVYRRSGGCALRLNGNAAARGAEQTIYGLKPNTTYNLTGWARTSGQPIRFGVKNHGAAEAYTTFTGTGNIWQKATNTFTTGSAATSATLYVYIPAGSNVGAADVDDFLLTEALPAEWSVAGIGSGLAGETGASDGRIVVRGSGNNLGTTSDSVQLVYQPMIDSGKITARLNSFEADNNVAKAGVMIRGSSAANAPFAMVHWLTQGQVEFYWRNSAGGTGTYAWATVSTPYPPLLRLVRSSNIVTAFFSTNGTAWTQVGTPQAIDLPSAALAGLAVTSNDTTNTSEAVFSNVSFTGDRDGDGLSDDYETNTGIYVSATDAGTDPDNPDTDGDGYKDGDEILNGTNPLVPNLEFTWQPGVSPGGSGTWSAAATSWKVGANSSAWIPGKTALFGGTAGTVTLGTDVTGIGGIIFNTTGYNLAGTGPLNFTPEATLSLNAAITDITTSLGGTSSLTVNGANQLNLLGDNRNFNGSLILTGNAQLRPYNTTSVAATGYELGGANTTIDIRSGSFIRWFNITGTPTYAANIHLNGIGTGGALVNDSGAANPNVILNGGITLDSDAKITGQNSGRFTVNGALSGPYTLTWDQPLLSSTIAGNVDLAALTKTSAGTLSFTSATINIQTLIASAGVLNFNPSADSTFTGLLGISGTATVTKTGIGTLILPTSNNFGPLGGTFTFGGTNTNNGAIRLGHPQALGYHSKILLQGQNSGVSRLELSGSQTFPLAVETWGRTMDIAYTGLRNVSGSNILNGSITQTGSGGGLYIDTLTGSQLTISGNVTNTLNAATFRDIRFTGGGNTIVQGAVSNSTTATPTLTKLTKEGTGTLTLNGTNTHGNASTDTVVSAGKLAVNGSITVSPITVAAAGTLAGTGSIASATVAGKLAPGNSAGTLAASGNVTITGTWETEIDGATADRLNVTGTLTLTGSTLDFNVLPGGTTQALYIIGSYGTLTGTPTLTDLPFGYVLNYNYNSQKQIALVRTATPFAIWANNFALTGNDALATADPDFDGIANSIEYLLGMTPNSPGTTGLPVAQKNGNNLLFTFTRNKAAALEFSSTIETSTSLTGSDWSAVAAENISVQDNGQTETVTATIPVNNAPALFARLKVL
ncbi:MAG: family 16 glycosylhydrolase [Luteolibacter sp.]